MTIPALRETHERLNAAWANGRPAHYGSAEAEYRLLRESCGWTDFSSDTKLIFTGEDRRGWLQGQVSNDLRLLEDGGFIESCVLSPTGHVVSDLRLWALPAELVGVLPWERRESVIKRLRQMLILEDVNIADLTDHCGLISVQGPAASETLAAILPLPRLSAGELELSGCKVRLLRNDRTGSGGWDILFEVSLAEDVIKLLKEIRPVGTEAWDIARLEAGLPVYGKDMNERTLVMEMGPAFIERNVAFEKGCYTGQEVVQRIRARGHVNRKWVGLFASDPLGAGARVTLLGQAVGTVTSPAVSPELGPIGAAMLRIEAARAGTKVIVEGIPAEVAEMPLLGR